MGRKVYDVTQKNDGSWSVKARGNERASAVTTNKIDAVQKAAQLGNNHGHAQVVIHKQDGKIQSERTYGNDPYPPKG